MVWSQERFIYLKNNPCLLYTSFQFVLSPTSRVGSVIYLVIGGGLGIGVYGILALVTRMADQLLGTRAASHEG